MSKHIKIFETDETKVPDSIKARATLTESPIGSKNFHLVVEFDFKKGDGYENLHDKHFHTIENIGGLHADVVSGKNDRWKLTSDKVIA